MILLGGVVSEPPLALALEAAERLGVDVAVLHQRQSDALDVDLRCEDGRVDGVLRLPGRHVRLAELTGVYLRLVPTEDLPEHEAWSRPDVAAHLVPRLRTLLAVLVGLTDLLGCRVAGRPAASASNASKPFQAQQIARFFPVPPTLVTDDPAAVRAFAAQHPSVVYKSASAVRSVVHELDDAALGRLERVRRLPTQFQARVPGVDIRVHVVGEDVFASEVTTTAVDYRYAREEGSTVRACDLPADVAERCVALAQALDLPFCGVDLRRRPDGEHVCFEVNPAPAYSAYQEVTGQPIADALVRWLAGGSGTPS